MQVITLPLSALALLGATDGPAAPPPAGPQVVINELQPFTPPGRQCHNGALQTNTEPSRQPQFERGPATPGMGQIIYAVDRRIDGCSVILAMNPSIQLRGEMKLSPEEKAEILGRR